MALTDSAELIMLWVRPAIVFSSSFRSSSQFTYSKVFELYGGIQQKFKKIFLKYLCKLLFLFCQRLLADFYIYYTTCIRFTVFIELARINGVILMKISAVHKIFIMRFLVIINFHLKGIVQPFELGGVTRLIQSAVKFCMAGNLKTKILMVQSHERSLKLICAA